MRNHRWVKLPLSLLGSAFLARRCRTSIRVFGWGISARLERWSLWQLCESRKLFEKQLPLPGNALEPSCIPHRRRNTAEIFQWSCPISWPMLSAAEWIYSTGFWIQHLLPGMQYVKDNSHKTTFYTDLHLVLFPIGWFRLLWCLVSPIQSRMKAMRPG